jgi:hypothetical protein
MSLQEDGKAKEDGATESSQAHAGARNKDAGGSTAFARRGGTCCQRVVEASDGACARGSGASGGGGWDGRVTKVWLLSTTGMVGTGETKLVANSGDANG